METSSVPATIMRHLEDAFYSDSRVDLQENSQDNVDKPDQKRRKSRMAELMDKYLPNPNDDSQNMSSNSAGETASSQKATSPVKQDNSNESDCFKLCRPWNKQDFLARLHTFHRVYNWFAKPEYLSAVRAALTGWVNSSRDCLHCHVCRVTYQHDASVADKALPPSMSENFLQQQHAESCPWRQATCEATFACVPHFDEDATQLAHITANAKQLLRTFLSLSSSNSLVITSCTSSETLNNETDAAVWQVDVSSLQNCVASSSDNDKLNNHDATNDVSFLKNLLSLATTGSFECDTATTQLLHTLNVSRDTATNDNSQRLAAIAVLVSLCGWSVSPSSSTCLHCVLCQRTFDFGSLTPRHTHRWDTLRQHRVHCPWVTVSQIRDTATRNEAATQSDNKTQDTSSAVVGWRHATQQIALRLVAAATAAENIAVYDTRRKVSRTEHDTIAQEHETLAKRQKVDDATHDTQLIFHKIRDILGQ